MYHHSSRGVADILGIVGGRPLAIEVKHKAGRKGPTEFQTRFLEQFEDAGGIAFVAYSIDDVADRLDLETNTKGKSNGKNEQNKQTSGDGPPGLSR